MTLKNMRIQQCHAFHLDFTSDLEIALQKLTKAKLHSGILYDFTVAEQFNELSQLYL